MDLRHAWGGCPGFEPLSQGTCNACVPASLASVLGLLACMRQGRNITFSAQRIWDCYDGSCAAGAAMDEFTNAVLWGPKAPSLLVPGGGPWLSASNFTRCGAPTPDRLLSVANHRDQQPARLQAHLEREGPAMAVWALTASDFARFSAWNRSEEPFVPAKAQGAIVQHALTVIGWANVSGALAWRVLNSMGAAWGEQGVGLVQAPLERNWYGFELAAPLHADMAFDRVAPPGGEVQSDVQVLLVTMAVMLVVGLACCLSGGQAAGPRRHSHRICAFG